MPSSGPNSGTGSTLFLTGNAWDDSGLNVGANDGATSNCTIALLDPDGAQSDYVWASSFGFAIPGGATINGIFVEILRYADNTVGIVDYSIRLTTNSGGSPVFVGTDKSAGALWPSALGSYESFGSSVDTWGRVWTVAEINDPYFGAAFAMQSPNFDSGADTGHVDHIRITVYYTGGSQRRDFGFFGILP